MVTVAVVGGGDDSAADRRAERVRRAVAAALFVAGALEDGRTEDARRWERLLRRLLDEIRGDET